MKLKDEELDELLKPVDADELELLLDELTLEWNELELLEGFELELEGFDVELSPIYDDDSILKVIEILQKTDNFYSTDPQELLDMVKKQL